MKNDGIFGDNYYDPSYFDDAQTTFFVLNTLSAENLADILSVPLDIYYQNADDFFVTFISQILENCVYTTIEVALSDILLYFSVGDTRAFEVNSVCFGAAIMSSEKKVKEGDVCRFPALIGLINENMVAIAFIRTEENVYEALAVLPEEQFEISNDESVKIEFLPNNDVLVELESDLAMETIDESLENQPAIFLESIATYNLAIKMTSVGVRREAYQIAVAELVEFSC